MTDLGPSITEHISHEADNLARISQALPLLLSDLCLLRFETFIQAGVDPLEAAARTMDLLSRYDVLLGLELPGESYAELKKEIEKAVATQAGRLTEEENRR